GVYIISATPFTESGAMDWPSTDRLVDFYLASGVDGITILGVMGEAPKLSGEEAKGFVARVAQRIAGRIPIIVGVSNPGTKLLGDFARRSMAIGAAGVMVAPPAGLKTEEQVYAYVDGVVAELGTDIPVVLQDYPQLTQTYMSATLVNRCFADFPSL